MIVIIFKKLIKELLKLINYKHSRWHIIKFFQNRNNKRRNNRIGSAMVFVHYTIWVVIFGVAEKALKNKNFCKGLIDYGKKFKTLSGEIWDKEYLAPEATNKNKRRDNQTRQN